MIHSMTGFGEASEQVDGVHYAVEVRSLNNRYFKATIRLPEQIAGLEAEVESQLRKRISRGSITVTIRLRQPGAAAAHQVNDEALLVYLDHLETIHDKVSKKDHALNIDLTALLALPGVLQPAQDDSALQQRARPVILGLCEKACTRLTEMRAVEGAMILQELTQHRESIRERLSAIAERAPRVIDEYHQRLRGRVNDLMARAELAVDQRDLIREVAIFAERADITEEVSRLGGHLEQVEQIVGSQQPEPAGRTLEFLAQELLREANTIASKSNDGQISRAIVEVKGTIDRIKEQVQNVE